MEQRSQRWYATDIHTTSCFHMILIHPTRLHQPLPRLQLLRRRPRRNHHATRDEDHRHHYLRRQWYRNTHPLPGQYDQELQEVLRSRVGRLL
jgi:hypothetical protein